MKQNFENVDFGVSHIFFHLKKVKFSALSFWNIEISPKRPRKHFTLTFQMWEKLEKKIN